MGLKIYSSTLDFGDLSSARIKALLTATSADRVCGLVFCGVSEEVEYHHLLADIKSIVYESLGRIVPVTLIPQYVLPHGGLSLDVYVVEDDAEIRICEQAGVCYGVIDTPQETMLFVEGIPSADFSASVSEQSREVFAKLDALLTAHDFAVDDIVRQWNYIGNIVAYKNGKQNYQEFNDARSSYYARGSWANGYPAATGIGVSSEGIIVGGIAFRKKGELNSGIYPIDNPLQVAAHVYSRKVLIDDGADAVKSTPKFERAKLIETSRGACCFVSGTAAIRGEDSVDASSVATQTRMTIENIEHLVSSENLVRYGCTAYDLKHVKLHVFIKHAEDYSAVREVVEEAYPCVPVLYTVADVCRGELLVEIEGILIS